jgi:hypothetical protein
MIARLTLRKMAHEILFDNSALSRLVEENDIDRNALVAGLRTLGTLRITSLNVLETARTPDADLRNGKLNFYRELSGTIAPMNVPLEVLGLIARAHWDGTGKIDVGDRWLYGLLETPTAATEDLRSALTERAREEEARFKNIHREMRQRFEQTFSSAPQDRFASEDAFLDFAFTNVEETLGNLVTEAYRDLTGSTLSRSDVRTFLDQTPAWKIFLAAHLHALWVRSLREKGPGKKKAGIVDTDTAVYLNFSERFITNDHPQLETLRVANRFNPRTTVVELYSELRARLRGEN